MKGIVIDANCGSVPALDEEYVYYQGGPQRNQLWRRVKDCSEPAQLIDPNCGGAPTVDGNYVYFQGGKNRDQLHRRVKDGSDGCHATQVLDKCCGATPVIDGDYVYYLSGDKKSKLVRKLKDGSGDPETIEELCIYPPVIDGDDLYFVGGHTDTTLYRRKKDDSGGRITINTLCASRPTIDGDMVYFTKASNPSNGCLYRMYKDGKSLPNQNMRVDLHAACVSSLVLQQYVIFQGSPDLQQLSAKSKEGTGSVIRLADYCGSAPILDNGNVYFLTSSSFNVLMCLPLPSYIN
jgi:hypothetical protein